MKKRVKYTRIIIIILLVFFTFIWAVLTDIIRLRKTEDMAGSEDAISILFVGSSHIFVGGLPGQLQTISQIYDVEIIYKDISRHGNRGGTLNELKDSAISEIRSGRFDYIILQDQTRRSLNDKEGLLDVIQILCAEARENGVEPVLYNSAWAMTGGHPDEERLKESTELYKKAADENDAILINAADAWIYAYQQIPGISLYTKFDLRGPHANKAGGFLTACLFAAVLFDLHIEDIPSDIIDLAQAAWDFFMLHSDLCTR